MKEKYCQGATVTNCCPQSFKHLLTRVHVIQMSPPTKLVVIQFGKKKKKVCELQLQGGKILKKISKYT